MYHGPIPVRTLSLYLAPFKTNISRMGGSLLLAVVVCLIVSEVGAAEPPNPSPTGSEHSSTKLVLGADVFAEKLGRDSFVTPLLYSNLEFGLGGAVCPFSDRTFCADKGRLSVRVPLRFRIRDREPTKSTWFRFGDWDTPWDWFRVLRSFELGTQHEPDSHLQIGELGPQTFGHGTIVQHYLNVLAMDQYKLGLAGRQSVPDVGGFELLTDDLRAPGLFAARGRLESSSERPLGSWQIGASLVVDGTAPTRLEDGVGAEAPTTVPLRPSQIADTTSTGIVGVDAEITAVDADKAKFVPYSDFNEHLGYGRGLHIGAKSRLSSSGTGVAEVDLQLEYLLGSRDYTPAYVDASYRLQRAQVRSPKTERVVPKLKAISDHRGTGVGQGGFGEVTVRISPKNTIGLAYRGYSGRQNSSLRLHVSSKPVEGFKLGLFGYRPGLSHIQDLKNPQKTLIIGEAQFALSNRLYGLTAYRQTWWLADDGTAVARWAWTVGIGTGIDVL